MKSIAEALVHALTYINCRPDPAGEQLDEDVQTLESIAAYLRAATEQEKDV